MLQQIKLREDDILSKLCVMILCHADKDDTKMCTHPVHSLKGWKAQSVKQRTRMSSAPGSIPATGSI